MASQVFPACKCIDEIDEQFAKRGATRISKNMSFYTNPEGLKGMAMADAVIETYLTGDKKRGEKALSIRANYCPFCGLAYVETPTTTSEEAPHAA